MVFRKKKPISKPLLALVAVVAVCAVIVLGWMLAKELYTGSDKRAYENAENIVINNVGASNGLVQAILAENPGCMENDLGKNTTYIMREVGDFALVHFGCGLDAYMFYSKTSGEWKNLSPTNQFIDSTPLCSHLKKHSIPSDIQEFCWNRAVSANGKMPKLVANPVN